MHGFALVFLGLTLGADPFELPRDVYEIQTREFAMPFAFESNRKDSIKQFCLFVSKDGGKTWNHEKNYKPSDKQAAFTAQQDGQYWFALQIEYKDGKKEPATTDALAASMKVYVNSERKALKVKKSYEDLEQEVAELRKKVEQLQKKLKTLESERKPR
jgi:hypothetical protein